jgi:hypothetical protein
MGGHLTDLQIWLFARREGGKNIKNTCKKSDGCPILSNVYGS